MFEGLFGKKSAEREESGRPLEVPELTPEQKELEASREVNDRKNELAAERLNKEFGVAESDADRITGEDMTRTEADFENKLRGQGGAK